MFKTIGLIIVLAVAAVLLLASTKPSTFRVERSTTIAAPPEKIAALINDFHQWNDWSPWAHLDPIMKTTYSGPPSGVGSVYEWEGNSKVGKGRMEILATEPTKTTIELDFLRPTESRNRRLRARTARYQHPRQLDHERPDQILSRQSNERLHLHGQGDRPRLRQRLS